jgi:hypothetical protein
MRKLILSLALIAALLLLPSPAAAEVYNSNNHQSVLSGATTCTAASGTFSPSLDIENTSQCSVNVNLTALTGTSPTFQTRLEGSINDSTFFALTTFSTNLTAAGVINYQQIIGARYLRVAWQSGGTVTACTATVYLACKR